MSGKKMITSDQAKPVKGQPRRPCSDCPWRRDALPGWLGGSAPALWIAAVHGEGLIQCHAQDGPQCAGAAIYRANVGKLPRSPDLLRLPADRLAVFSSPDEFKKHHAGAQPDIRPGKMIAK